MIKSSELRIGNWVEEYNPHHPQYKNFVKVESVNEEGINLIGSVDYDCGIIEANPCINPIPLTPELLVKCGFNEFSKNYFIYGDYSLLQDMGGWHFDYIDADSRGDRSIAYPQHLHQLQNLYFALTGEELSIEL
jgi:hypothetical protein